MKAWLIEYKPMAGDCAKTPLWWNGTEWNGCENTAWTWDANNAIKFTDQISAFVVIMALGRSTRELERRLGRHAKPVHEYGPFIATEHEWPDAD